MRPLLTLTAATMLALATPALAAEHSASSTSDYKAAMATMDKAMPMNFTGDADEDFARLMIPHHQGAIAIAEIELKHGKDPMLRKMAQEMIAKQKEEISSLERSLAD